ncbi:TetR family transcriptional regulator [Actinocatenispora thailandica]|uniref:TetR family transcriptional regulator n=1 Tax=Actinocatenispora thailandica TaxID=227318 RepID=A0A7R7DPZ8_9ACTN|nr:TetR/AcrR family transcriptional regulator [Actinocatenispora thailandica]BCJ35622.1 TetR family transcriptional regulator [Actinocatenispora thailandica]
MATTKGRPRSFDRSAALAAAQRLFWEHGYEATSIAALTTAMGIRPPSLYAAFGDKRGLFEEVVETYGANEGAVLQRALDSAEQVRPAFRSMLHALADAYTAPGQPRGCLVITAANSCGPDNPEVAESLRRRRSANLDVFTGRFAAAMRRGELPADTDPAALAGFFAAVVEGMSQRARDRASTAELHAIADLALAALPAEPTR